MDSFTQRIDEDFVSQDRNLATDQDNQIVPTLDESAGAVSEASEVAPRTPTEDMDDFETENKKTDALLSRARETLSRPEAQHYTPHDRRVPSFEPPEFVQRLNVFEEVELGASTSFMCQCRGYPRPECKWYLDDKEISADHPRVVADRSLEDKDGTLRLVVNDAQKSDEGAYKCKAENPEGIASTTGYLSITGFGIPPEAPTTTPTTSTTSSSPRSDHGVSCPPLLRAITEQQSMEEREEAAYETELTPLQQFIENVERGATSWPYAELDFLRTDEQRLATVATAAAAAADVTTMSASSSNGLTDDNSLVEPYTPEIPQSFEGWTSEASMNGVNNSAPQRQPPISSIENLPSLASPSQPRNNSSAVIVSKSPQSAPSTNMQSQSGLSEADSLIHKPAATSQGLLEESINRTTHLTDTTRLESPNIVNNQTVRQNDLTQSSTSSLITSKENQIEKSIFESGKDASQQKYIPDTTTNQAQVTKPNYLLIGSKNEKAPAVSMSELTNKPSASAINATSVFDKTKTDIDESVDQRTDVQLGLLNDQTSASAVSQGTVDGKIQNTKQPAVDVEAFNSEPMIMSTIGEETKPTYYPTKPAHIQRQRRIEEIDFFKSLDWCVEWFHFPWIFYYVFALTMTVLSSAMELDPALVILIVGVISTISFLVLNPSKEPTTDRNCD